MINCKKSLNNKADADNEVHKRFWVTPSLSGFSVVRQSLFNKESKNGTKRSTVHPTIRERCFNR
jgi:hypothetical protein